jgi:hypothetical protein
MARAGHERERGREPERERKGGGDRGAARGRGAGPGAEAAARPPADVHLGAEFVARWAKELDATELRLYVALARLAATRVWHDPAALAAEVGEPGAADLERRLSALEKRRLVEVVRRRGALHFHLLCRGKDGIHRAEAVRPSIREAIDFHQAMTSELLAVAAADESEELRERIFSRYPPLRDEWLFHEENREPGSPEWTLWMELSLFLMNRFEEKYGDLKSEHAEVFKEVSAQLLRLKLEMVDGLTKAVLDRRAEIFRQNGGGWIGGVPESAFLTLPLVRELSRKYRVGAEQIYLNAIEALQAEGLCVVELDARGHATDLVLPSTTGLGEEEERLVFLHVEEMTRQEIERFEETLGRIRAAKEKYARYLLDRGVGTVADLARGDRVEDVDALLQTVVDRVNEALELVSEDGEDPRVAAPEVRLEEALALYGGVRRAEKGAR